MVDVLLRSLEEAEGRVRKYESGLSEEDIVPADAAAIQNLRDQLGVRQEPPQLQVKVFNVCFSPLTVEFVPAVAGGGHRARRPVPGPAGSAGPG